MFATLTLPATALRRDSQRTRKVQVRSADELRRALREGRDTPLALDASGLNCVLRADEGRRLIEVQGGMTWSALAKALGPAGEPLKAWADSTDLPDTVAQAVSAGAAAPDGTPLSACVQSVVLVTVDGELRRLERGTPTGLFQLVLGGQGVIGLLYSVTLRIDELLRAAERARPPVEIRLPAPDLGNAVPCEVQTLLPPEQVEEFVAHARCLAAERRVALLRISVSRLLPGEDAALGWAKREWARVSLSLQVRATLGASVKATEIRRLLHAAAIARGGSFPVSAAHEVSRPQLLACYPELPAFLAEKRRYDPAERLQNAWYRSVSALLRAPACESRWENRRQGASAT